METALCQRVVVASPSWTANEKEHRTSEIISCLGHREIHTGWGDNQTEENQPRCEDEEARVSPACTMRWELKNQVNTNSTFLSESSTVRGFHANTSTTAGRAQLRLGRFPKHRAGHPKLPRCSKTTMELTVRFRMSLGQEKTVSSFTTGG